MPDGRYDRQISFFGATGQDLIRRTKYAVIGLGGTGSHVVQQLAYLGAIDFRLVDADLAEESNLNRLIGARPADVAREYKVDVAARMIGTIQTDAKIDVVRNSFVSTEGFGALRGAEVVFGCVDRDSARLILNELCQAYCIPYIDLATGIDRDNPREYGGRVHYSVGGERCIVCDGLLDQEEIRFDFATEEQRRADADIYGVPRHQLANSGPSVVSLNGLLASAAVLEFLVGLTGLREPRRLLVYRGFWGTLSSIVDPPSGSCAYCKGVRGKGDLADLARWIREPLGH